MTGSTGFILQAKLTFTTLCWIDISNSDRLFGVGDKNL